jgi:sugar phosphate isomerase/epimerase
MIGITSITFRNKSVDEIIEFAQKAKIDGIEWGSDVHVLPTNTKSASIVAKKTSDAGLQIFSYGTYYKLGQNQDFDSYLATAIALKTSRMRIWAGVQSSKTISNEERNALINECIIIAQKAKKANIELCFEYHRGTLTDTKESSLQLMQQVNQSNVFLYWQPNPDITEEEQYNEINLLHKYLKTIHFFNWSKGNIRHLMKDGKNIWQKYIALIDTNIPYLLEFTLDNLDSNALSDLHTMKELLSQI